MPRPSARCAQRTSRGSCPRSDAQVGAKLLWGYRILRYPPFFASGPVRCRLGVVRATLGLVRSRHLRQAKPVRITAPVIWRGSDIIQVGLDPDRSATLTQAPPEADRAIRLLLAGRTSREVHALFPSLDTTWLSTTQVQLLARGLIATPPPPHRSRIVVAGSGPLADACEDLLSASGACCRRENSDGPVARSSPHDHLVLVATDRVEPDRGLLSSMRTGGLPHLVARCEPGRTVVGPFVKVGHTPCQQCIDLVRCDLDPHWPHLLAQLCRMVVVPDPVQTAWAAATVATQVRAWWSGLEPETSYATLELDHDRQRVAVRPWRQHPACSCGDPRQTAA